MGQTGDIQTGVAIKGFRGGFRTRSHASESKCFRDVAAVRDLSISCCDQFLNPKRCCQIRRAEPQKFLSRIEVVAVPGREGACSGDPFDISKQQTPGCQRKYSVDIPQAELSQSAVNDKAGARTPLALIFASLALALSLLFLTDSLENLPKAVLAAIVFTAVLGLIDIRALSRMWRIKSSTSCSRSVA